MKLSRARITGVLVPLLALVVLALPVRAGYDWCMSDPIVRLNGTQVQILVSIPEQYVLLVDGPTRVNIATPEGTARELLLTDAGFNGHGEVVRFPNLDGVVEGGTFPTRIDVRVPIDKAGLAKHEVVPVKVEVFPQDGEPLVAMGTSKRTSVELQVAGR